MSAKWLLIVLCSLVLGGCWDRTEINDLAIITVAAVDKAENDHIRLSVQLFVPRALGAGGASSGGSSAGGGKLTMMQSSEGVNIADAMSKLQTKIPREIFWGHCKVYLFGEEVAKKGLSDHIDFLVRHPEPRNRSYLYVSKGNGHDLLKLTPLLERSTAEVLREFANLHIGMPLTLVDYRNMLRGESEAAAIPMVENGKKINHLSEVQKKSTLTGTAIFKKDKMIGTLTLAETRGMLWLRNEVTRAAISVKVKDEAGVVSVNPIRSTTKLIPTVENGKWLMRVQVDTEADVVENGTRLDLMRPELLQMVKNAVRSDIEQRMRSALDVLQHKLNADVVNFAAAFHRKYPKEWEKANPHWDEIFPQVDVDMQVNVEIRRPGLIANPAGIPREEVKRHK
ncbi:Ger(x)C family spore germination protein [Brevibacillus sp. GCM10020057]|uniref:Ger(x)C family spore germination protein n=1 Tax=Brevibacillus sp. GCM10020057 TaxID=3317327 RepID=UPI00362E5286